jgi:hypothetical protein
MEVIEKHNRRKMFGSMVREMISSTEENNALERETDKYETEICGWHQSILEKQYEIYKRFEKIMFPYLISNRGNK